MLKLGDGSITFEGSAPWEEKGRVQQYLKVLKEGRVKQRRVYSSQTVREKGKVQQQVTWRVLEKG